MAEHAVFTLTDVSIPGRARPRLEVRDLSIGQGITAVLGASGAGKTTLLNLLSGFVEAPDPGRVKRPISLMRFDNSQRPVHCQSRDRDFMFRIFWRNSLRNDLIAQQASAWASRPAPHLGNVGVDARPSVAILTDGLLHAIRVALEQE